MRNGNLFFSALQFLMVMALFLLSGAFFAFHFSFSARELISDWIVQGKVSFALLGIITTAITILLGICFWAMQRGSFIRIKMQKGDTLIDEKVIRAGVDHFWDEHFPKGSKPIEIYCANQHIEIITENSSIDLTALESQLGEFLKLHYAYEKEFFITFTQR